MKTSTVLIALSAALVACVAQADIPNKSVYIGVYGGEHIPADAWQLGTIEGTDQVLSESAVWGLRVGGFFTSWLGLEGNVSFMPAETSSPIAGGDSDNVQVGDFGASVVFQATDGRMAWYALTGGGGYFSADSVLESDVDAQWHAGVGIKAQLWDGGALRLQGRMLLTDFDQDDPHLNAELTLGLDFYIWRTPDDRDGDGIVDDEDNCPDVPGVASAKGCPDKDGDGFQDSVDKCPDVPGVESAKGCPDKDGDTLQDSVDRCPNVAGPVENKGCPDRDGDGILDPDDTCPDVPGLRTFHGCPDTDGDGIQDSKDKCPKVPGPAKTQGCPDTDGDGIADVDDKCPKIRGVAKLDGCLPKEIAEKFSGAIKGIYFKTGSDKIRAKSFVVLDDAVRVLKEWDTVRLRVEGHTDDRGKDENNMTLSVARAASVRTYMVEKGIAATRLTSEGFGETKPVGDNKTKDGRQQNRRIEFTVLAN
ncbi:MAG: outer membrane protein OmpA-like peptidoglycan-associated protein [Myxococcota bacterium]|jgi:outer membrane protein OmpA-like peptidoglycan-associated protein